MTKVLILGASATQQPLIKTLKERGFHTIVVSNLKPLDVVEAELKGTTTGFKFKDESTISKQDEGLYKWCVDHEDHAAEKHPYWPDYCLQFKSNSTEPQNLAQVSYNATGGVNFRINSALATPIDPSGKIVLYNENRARNKKKCLVISRRLGLTRLGNYSGGLDAESISDDGVCRVQDWTEQ